MPSDTLRTGVEKLLLQCGYRGCSTVAVKEDGLTAFSDNDDFFSGPLAHTPQTGSRQFRIRAEGPGSDDLFGETVSSGSEEDNRGDRSTSRRRESCKSWLSVIERNG